MPTNNDNAEPRNFRAPTALSKGTARHQTDQSAFLDLENERTERQLKTDRLRRLRMAAENEKRSADQSS